jgi:hypothetical protein
VTAARRYRLGQGRELAVSSARGLIVLSIHASADGGACASGPIALRHDDLETLRSALGDLLDAVPAEGVLG